MKAPQFLYLFLVFPFTLFAQIGINTTNPDASSILDIQSSDKGLLLPRVALTGPSDNTTIESPSESLLVYNTSTSGGLTKGFYFWSGSAWSAVSNSGSPSSEKWSLQGNSLSGSEFFGSTNWSQLQFRVNNAQIGLLHPNGGISFGLNASANKDNSIAIGTNANASASNEATAVGPATNASGYRSAAIGYNASASSNNSLALGTNTQAIGQNSSVLGVTSSATAQNATAIGYNVTANQPNTIILGNDISDVSNWNATKVGIGTSSPSEKLEVNGNIKVSGKLNISSGDITIANGTEGVGKILVSDANGKASWEDASSLSEQAYAEAYANASSTLSAYSPITFGTTVVQSGVTINSNNFQVSTSGTYKITYAVSIEKTSGGDANVGFFLTNGWGSGNKIVGSTAYVHLDNGDKITATATKFVQLSASNMVYVFPDTTNTTIETVPEGTYFNIELVKAD